MLKKIVEIAHDILREGMDEKCIAVDFTCGSGNDTLFLSQHAYHVYSYDIQKDALDDAQKLCAEACNIEFHLKSHLYFDDEVEHFDRGIFNLGYYPKGDKSITTSPDEVLSALKKAIDRLNSHGKILLVCYPGFESGLKEAEKIEHELFKLESRQVDVYKFQIINRNHAPYLIGIEKH